MTRRNRLLVLVLAAAFSAPLLAATEEQPVSQNADRILTPPAPDTPRINGPRVYGERPGRPFLYTIPATGDRPMKFSADGLPDGLKLDQTTGRITGSVQSPGEFKVTLQASNAKGSNSAPLDIIIGDQIALTPPMGWNSWNCWAGAVDQDKVLSSARAMVSSGLINHGWTYINIDDTWQGKRGGEFHALQGNDKFPDMKAMCDQIHDMGLKAGIYSTPWVTSYAGYAGGSAENPEGTWTKPEGKKTVNKKVLPWAIGKYHFMASDAKQYGAWGFDYLKYDWNPIETPDVQEMHDALLASGRDIVLSLSNSAPFDGASDWARLSNAWRTGNDIRDNWYSVSGIAFSQGKWDPYGGPGHWNDPDMLVVGYVGWGPKLHLTSLTPDEQYTHISMWSLLSAPMLIGCDLDKLDAFTLSLLTNDEVLAIDQDALGKPATLASETGPKITVERKDGRAGNPHAITQMQVWSKELADGSHAVGLFNVGDADAQVTANWSDLKIDGKQTVRDLWRQKDLGDFSDHFDATVPAHGAVLVKLTPTKS